MYIKPLDKTALSNALEHMSNILNEFKEVTFFGDFNARHKSFGDHASNTHRTQLIKWLKDNNTRRIAPIGEKWTFIKNNCFSIPDHIISTLNISAFVEHQTSLGDSDHRPIVGIIKSDNPHIYHHVHRFRGWNRFRFKDPDIQEQILHFIGSNVEDICEKIDIINEGNLTPQQKADDIDSLICLVYTSALNTFIGKSSPKKKID